MAELEQAHPFPSGQRGQAQKAMSRAKKAKHVMQGRGRGQRTFPPHPWDPRAVSAHSGHDAK